MWHDQQRWPIRCEWGARGVEMLAPAVDALIIVDVLSFSTCVDIATSRGAAVFPYRWKDESAVAFARSVNGTLAGARSRETISLSPVSLLAVTGGTRVVLPSPNGATLSGLTGTTPTLTGCFRNAKAVAHRARMFGNRIGVVPAGEQWPDGSLRPALEDWLGAGAILAQLDGTCSPEAHAARLAFVEHHARLAETVASCASGRELIEAGWEDDVRLATELDVSISAPLLSDRAFIT